MNTERKKTIKKVLIILVSVLLISVVIAVIAIRVIRKAGPQLIDAGLEYIVAVRDDGSVIYQDERGNDKIIWQDKDIVSVAVDNLAIFGLTANGKVLVEGYHNGPEKWDGIIAISAGGSHIVGLKADGTVVSSGDNGHGECNTSTWTDIVAVSAGGYHTVGLKSNGQVVATGQNEKGQCDVENWRGIIQISAGYYHTAGLKADGTVVAVGDNWNGCCDTQNWKGIKSVSAGGIQTVGLKLDGTVVSVGLNKTNLDDVSKWKDIRAIGAGLTCTTGISADGTAVAVGESMLYTPKLSSWSGLRTKTSSLLTYKQQAPIMNSVFPAENINSLEYWIGEGDAFSRMIIWAIASIAACLIPVLLLRFAFIRKRVTAGKSLLITVLWCLICIFVLIVCIYYSLCERIILVVPILMSVVHFLILNKGLQKESGEKHLEQLSVDAQQQKQTSEETVMSAESDIRQELLFCHKCGAKVQADSQFCHHCGARIR